MVDEDALVAAFWAYERALTGNDVPVLERAFADSADTLRTEATTTLVGADHISAYRRTRTPPPDRVVERLHVRPLADGVALVVAEARRADGGRGVQTQVWRSGPAGWQVTAAHVATSGPPPPPPAVADAGVWRNDVARPLRPATSGPLADLAVAVKDLFAVTGVRTGAGNPTWLAHAPVETTDAAAVGLLVAAGAGLAGLAQTDELAFSLAGTNVHSGTPVNPAVAGAIPGGSSSGPAVAVAAGWAEVGLGTDTAGSIRVPASYCGLFGLRPTHGAVPVGGVVPLAASFDTVGLLARDAGVLRRTADVLLPAASPVAVGRLVLAEDLLATLGDDVGVAFEAALRALAGRHGLPVERRASVGDVDGWLVAFRTMQTSEAWRAHGAFVDAHPGALAPAVEARFRLGAAVTDAQYAAAAATMAEVRRELAVALPPGDALVLPAAASVAPAVDLPAADMETVRAATMRLTCVASFSGRPAVVAPVLRVGPSPVGLSLVGAPGSDRALLELL